MEKSPLYPENALIMAPLSGFTDLAYRRAARRGGCRYAFTEMVDAASLSYANGNKVCYHAIKPVTKSAFFRDDK